jgi:invasion protein IalB
MRFLTLLLFLAALPAMATEPAPEVPAGPAATENSAPRQSPVATAEAREPESSVAAVAPAAATAAEEFKAPAGYKKKTRGGETVYCRSETPVGTRFPTEYCFTRNDLQRIEKNKQSMQREMQLRTKMCTTGSACSGGG